MATFNDLLTKYIKIIEPEKIDWFYVEDVSGESNPLEIRGNANDNAPKVTIEWSSNGTNWSVLGTTGSTPLYITISANSKIYFRSKNDTWGTTSTSYYNCFYIPKPANVGGNILSLAYGDEFTNQKTFPNSDYKFTKIFYNTSIISAADLKLYSANNSYSYNYAFDSCISLITPPELPASTLGDYAYNYMFNSCTALTVAPLLPASTLYNYSYSHMFYNCSQLNTINTLTIDIGNNSLSYWVKSVAATGTFTKFRDTNFTVGSINGIPEGWTVQNYSISSITPSIATYTAKSFQTDVYIQTPITITTTNGLTCTYNDKQFISITQNTGSETRTFTQNIPFMDSYYTVTIVQTANDTEPTKSWSVTEYSGAYTFVLNDDGYYKSNNYHVKSSFAYCTLNYEGYNKLSLQCISNGENNYDYGIISEPDTNLLESNTVDTINVFKSFKGESSTTPVVIEIPSDFLSHYITIKYRKDSSTDSGLDRFEFKVVE